MFDEFEDASFQDDGISVGSSIDGELNEFLETQGIFRRKETSDKSLEKRRVAGDVGNVSNSGGVDHHNMDEESLFLDHSATEHSISGIDTTEILLSNCSRVNTIFNQSGFFPVTFTSSDINNSTQTISVFLVDSWAASFLPCLLEIMERNSEQSSIVKDANISAWKEEVSKEAVQNRVTELQQKLSDVERRERIATMKARDLGKGSDYTQEFLIHMIK